MFIFTFSALIIGLIGFSYLKEKGLSIYLSPDTFTEIAIATIYFDAALIGFVAVSLSVLTTIFTRGSSSTYIDLHRLPNVNEEVPVIFLALLLSVFFSQLSAFFYPLSDVDLLFWGFSIISFLSAWGFTVFSIWRLQQILSGILKILFGGGKQNGETPQIR